ncbi:hypothetical protein DFQ27_005402 [Actinomortierella ambigua]|uniref:Protein kinase domain-containing protein n=1 Tax=Actinomortierella ambigua TaxID=1343610 RepID=A0A9P6Q2E1_9FUNG|nr:hypothetical protein DFQ27_005402 [Actinomortierella ambigua]
MSNSEQQTAVPARSLSWRNKPIEFGPLIGAGAYGSVYRVTCGDEVFAAKTFPIQEEEKRVEAIQQEIKIMEKLRHPNIIQFYGTCEHNGLDYLIMDLAEKGCLSNAILQRELNWPNKTRIAHEIARGLEYIHAKDVFHRDLKSANVLLDKHMTVKLCDFGFSKIKSAASVQSGAAIKGTLRWMAPEILSKDPTYSAKSDVYALGMVMWEMAANSTVPFIHQLDDGTVALLVGDGEREELPDDTPDTYRQWVEKCWEQDPSERPDASSVILVEDTPLDIVTEEGHLSVTFSTDSNDRNYGKVAQQSMAIKPPAAQSPKTLSLSTLSPSTLSPSTPSSSTLPPSILSSSTLSQSAGSSSNVRVRNESDVSGPSNAPSSGRSDRVSVDSAMISDNKGQVEVDLMQLAAKYEHGDGTGDIAQSHSAAIFYYRQAAKQGNAEAQVWLAKNYLHGNSMPQSESDAAKWYRLAGEQGHLEAQFAIADMCFLGRGVRVDYVEASSWYRKAAEQGHVDAQINLGAMYQRGMGVSQSDTEAVVWYQKAAEQDSPVAQYKLGLVYEEGKPGIRKDPQQAIEWYRRAAARGHPEAESRKTLLEQLPKRRGIIRSMFK